eukprot:TRINITY_DN1735_c0_g5_i1.p2 TRINITY_DN1735_c0_g5~~TRINITY_DN1735_c0_g5_i1.p2  ORF type:complete len:123 (-),score=54.33 TRINITY_DN1735_c0_g5_i1:168-536(-)
MVVYDVSDRDSFNAVQTWITDVNKLGTPGMTKILIANKSDLAEERRVAYEEGQHLAKKLGLKFIESSAKDSSNVFDAFKMMTMEMIKKCKSERGMETGVNKKPVKEGARLREQESKKSKGCC